MYLSNAPGVWIPLSEEESAQFAELLDEIAGLAQIAPGGERHEDRLTELSLLIGTAAVGAAVGETEGPQAEKKWRVRQRQGAGDVLIQSVRYAWRQWRQRKASEETQGNVIALKAHRNS